MRKFSVRDLTLAAAVAALYAALTIALPAYGPLQFRFAEALVVLPFLFPGTAVGLTMGCFIANLFGPYGPVDLICGTAATAIAAAITIRVPNKWLAPLPAVLSNGLIVGAMLAWYETGFGPGFWPLFAANGCSVAVSELGACYVLGLLLLAALPKIQYFRTLMPKKRLISLE